MTPAAQIAHLKLQVERLSEENALLRRSLRGDDDDVSAAMGVFGVTRTEASVLLALQSRYFVRHEDLYSALYLSTGRDSDSLPDTHVLRSVVRNLRPKLAKRGIEIVTVWGVGWKIKPEHRRAIRTMLDHERGA